MAALAYRRTNSSGRLLKFELIYIFIEINHMGCGAKYKTSEIILPNREAIMQRDHRLKFVALWTNASGKSS